MRPQRIALACVSVVCVVATTLPLQGESQFQVVTQDAVAEVPGLRIVTVRDSQRSACYAVFILNASTDGVDVPVSTESDSEGAQTSAPDRLSEEAVQRIRAAGQDRDRRLAQLRSDFERRTGRTYEQWTAQTPTSWPDVQAMMQYEYERRQIDDDYEQVLRTEVPNSYPSAVLVPGMRTGGFEDQATAIRRAMLDLDPSTTMKTLAAQLARIDQQLTRVVQAPRLAASGPFPCP